MENSNKIDNLNYIKLQGCTYKNTEFFSNLRMEEKIRDLKKKNIDMFKFLNSYLVDEIKRNSSKPEEVSGHRSNSIILEDLKNIKLFNETPQNKKEKPKQIEALTQEEVLFKRIYNRQLNNIMQVKDYTMNPTGIVTKDQIRKSMARFFNKGDMNKKIMTIKNKMYLMKGMVDFALPEINVDIFKQKTNDFRKSDGKIIDKNRKFKLSSLQRKSTNIKINPTIKSKSLFSPAKITKVKIDLSDYQKKSIDNNKDKENNDCLVVDEKEESILSNLEHSHIKVKSTQNNHHLNSKKSLENTSEGFLAVKKFKEEDILPDTDRSKDKKTLIKFKLQSIKRNSNVSEDSNKNRTKKSKMSILINPSQKNFNNKKSIKFNDS